MKLNEKHQRAKTAALLVELLCKDKKHKFLKVQLKINQLLRKNQLDHQFLVELIQQLSKTQNQHQQLHQHNNNKVPRVSLVVLETQINQSQKQHKKRQNRNRKFSPNNKVLNNNPQVVVSNVVVLLVSNDK